MNFIIEKCHMLKYGGKNVNITLHIHLNQINKENQTALIKVEIGVGSIRQTEPHPKREKKSTIP